MIKKILILFFTLVFVLSGCHGSKNANSFVVPETFDESKTYELTFWAKNDSNKNQVNIYKKAIEDFEKLYPNIKINLSLYTDYGQIYNDVITNISTGTTPNVCITYPDHIATYLTGNNVVVSLDDLLTNEKYGLGGSEVNFDSPKKEEVITKFLDECIIDGSYYALPFMRSTEALYINKTYVEKLGYTIPDEITWDFVFEVSEKALLLDDDGNYLVNGQKTMIPFIYKSSDNMMIQMLKQLDAPYSDDDGNILLFNDTTKEILLEIGEYAKDKAFSTFKISGYPANFLNAGQCIFAIDSTAGSTWMGANAPLVDIAKDKMVDFEIIVREIPQFDYDNKKMISQGPSICIFNKSDSDEVLASWLFAQFLLTNDVQIAYSKTEGYVPVTSKARESEEYQEYLALGGIDNDEHYSVKIEATKLLIENTDNTFTTSVFNGSASLRNGAGQLIEEVCKGARRGKIIDEEFIDNLYSDINSLYRLDQVGSKISAKDLGPLPIASKVLLGSLATIWILIISSFIYKKVKTKNN